jgi:hypothetical protein
MQEIPILMLVVLLVMVGICLNTLRSMTKVEMVNPTRDLRHPSICIFAARPNPYVNFAPHVVAHGLTKVEPLLLMIKILEGILNSREIDVRVTLVILLSPMVSNFVVVEF